MTALPHDVTADEHARRSLREHELRAPRTFPVPFVAEDAAEVVIAALGGQETALRWLAAVVKAVGA